MMGLVARGVFSLMVVLSPTALMAQEQVVALDEVVVTATRGEKSVKDAPGSVTVITQKDIKKRNAQSIDSILKSIPGFSGRRETEFSTLQPNLNIRGISGTRTLFLLDGMNINDPRTGSMYFDGLPLDTVEQIEAVKGASSALYGSQGLAGVINIRTMMPQDRMFSVRTGYGSSWNRGEAFDDMSTYSLTLGNKLADRFSFLLNYNRKETNGFAFQKNVTTASAPKGSGGYQPTTTNAGGRANMWGDKGDGTVWSDAATAKMQFEVDEDSQFRFSFIKTRLEVDYDDPHTYTQNAAGNPLYFPNEYSFLTTASGRERNFYQGSYETSFGELSAKLDLGLIDTTSYYNRTPGSTSSTTINGGPGTYMSAPTKSYSADLQFSSPFFSHQTLTWGLAYKYDTSDSITYRLANWRDENSKTGVSNREGGKTRTVSLYLQDEIRATDDLTFYLGGRLDWWKTWNGYYKAATETNYEERSQSSFSPKASVVYNPWSATTVKASVGRAFNAPTLYQLYNKYIGSYTTMANPGLKPESVWSWDLAVTQGLWTGGEITVGYFENHLSDMIYTKDINKTTKERTNIGQARSRGFEVEFKQELGEYVTFSTDYTYTDAKIREHDNQKLVGARLQDVPQHTWNLGLDVEYGPVSTFLAGRYISKRYQTDGNTDSVNNVYTSYDPVFTADAKISYAVTDNISASVSVNNILDREYYNYYEAPGRSWFLDVSYNY